MLLFESISAGIFVLYAAFIIYFLFGLYRLQNKRHRKNTNLPTVSVVVAARNEEENIRDLLDDLVKQNYPKNKLEVIISNDRSTDNTWLIIKEFISKCNNINGINITEPSTHMAPKKYALTKAIKSSSAEIIISTDADCRVSKNWVGRIIESFNEDTGILVGYSKVDTASEEFFDHYQSIDFLALMTANAGTIGWENPWTGSGQNIAYRRSAFEQINGFNPVANKISGDDFYLVQAISKIAKARFNINSESFVTTKSMNTVYQFINQRTRWASNTRKLFNTNSGFLSFLFVNLFTNIILLSAVFSIYYRQYLPMLFGFKFLLDTSLLFYGSKLFKTKIRIDSYLAWFFLQPLYTAALAVLSMIGKYRWKV